MHTTDQLIRSHISGLRRVKSCYLSAVVECEEQLFNPQFGNLELNSGEFGSVATYTCFPGYDLNGDSIRTCQSNGEWTGSAPTCESK